jgi:uncharacterized protein with FMN-binding domain
MDQSPVLQTLGRAARKLALSAFVIFTFLIYAVHERLAGPDQTAANTLPDAPRPTSTLLAPTTAPRRPTTAAPTAAPRTNVPATAAQPTDNQPAAATDTAVPPTDVPAPTDTAVPTAAPATGQYKDGTYKGPTVDAYYGYVQVEADVQNGQIADVKFLQYPSDRRTSQRINSIAMPYLTTEAIQAQSASVDIISGATLTSEAFAQSLQAALQNAVP